MSAPDMSGHPRVDHNAMRGMAPDADPALLNAAADLLAPVQRTLDEADLGALDGVAPAFTFDPDAAPRTWRRVPLPPAPPARTPDPPSAAELPWTPVADLAALVRAGAISAAEVVEAYSARIKRLDPELAAFITVTLDADPPPSPEGRQEGRLARVPIGVKDIIDTAGIATTCGSRILADRVPERDAEVWRRLGREGATCAGKMNTHEFAAGGTAENDHYGHVRNPWDTSRVAGGSSGGSAAAVATAMVGAALGTDTAGSVRIPAGCCGIVGLKPTYGIVPIDGVYPLSWTLDTVGPITRTVRDAALLLDILADLPETNAVEPAARAGAANGLAGIRIGVPRSWLSGIQPAVAERFQEAVRDLRGCGAEPVEVELPDLEQLVAVNRAIIYAESSACHEPILRTRPDYGPTIRARMEVGRYLLAGEYLTAQRLRTAACHAWSAAWPEADLIALPVLACTAPTIGSPTVDLDGRSAAVGPTLVRFTGPVNVTGLPAITVPCGFCADDLPVGLQLIAPPYQERLLCFAAAGYEAATPHHTRRPGLG
ncbi:MAG: hypothetical protein GEV03_13975 [Streptosporangiales bacterium]|nr:hypothetical protein [Streptosporangiales bacterium]